MLIAILAIVTIAIALGLYLGLTAKPLLDDLVDLRYHLIPKTWKAKPATPASTSRTGRVAVRQRAGSRSTATVERVRRLVPRRWPRATSRKPPR